MIVFGGYTDGSVYLKDIYEYDFGMLLNIILTQVNFLLRLERRRWRGIKALKGGQNIVGKHSASYAILHFSITN
jgi:hypothetical protein